MELHGRYAGVKPPFSAELWLAPKKGPPRKRGLHSWEPLHQQS